MAETTSKLQAQIKALTNGKVDIMLNADQFKNTTQILREMSVVWKDMTDIQRAAALELLGGKRQANILSSLITNFNTVEDVINTSLNSEGSALAENEKYLDSIQGKTDQLKNSMQTLWNNALGSDFLKILLDIANGFVKAADSAGLFNTAIAAFLGYKTFRAKNNSIFDIFKIFEYSKDSGFGLNKNSAIGAIINGSLTNGFSGAAAAAKSFGVGAKLAAVGTNLLNAALTMGISLLAGFVLEKVISGIEKLVTAQKRAKEAAEEALNSYRDTQNTLKEQKSTIDELSSSYERLSKGVNLNTNENINLTTGSYQEYLDTCNKIADMYPNLVTGFDAQGNAILSLKGNVDELVQSYKEAAQASRQKLIADGSDIFSTFKTNYDTETFWGIHKTGIKQQKELAEDLLEKINSGTDEEIAQYISGILNLKMSDQEGSISHSDLKDLMESAGIEKFYSGFGIYDTSDVDVNKLKEQTQKIVSFIKSSSNQIKTETNKVASLMNAYLGEDFDYASLTDRNRSFIDQIVSNLDAEFIDGFDSADALYNWIKTNVVSAFKDKSVVDAINDLSNLQLDFAKGDINYANYQEQLDKIIGNLQTKLDDDALAQVKLSFGVDEESLEIDKNHIVDILDPAIEDVEDKISKLSVKDLQIAGELEVPEGVTYSWDELSQKIQEAKVAAMGDFNVSDYSDSILSITENIGTFQDALDKLNSGEFTMKDYLDLIGDFPDLAKGVDISSKSFKGLTTNLVRAIKSSPKSLIKDLRELRAQLLETGKSTTEIDQLIASIESMPEDALDSMIGKYSTLADEIISAKEAQNELKAAMEENPNEGYETRGEALDYMKKALERGEIGSESNVWNVAEKWGFTYDSAKLINENADALANFIAVREPWYKQDDDGNYTFEGMENFIKTVQKAVEEIPELQELMTWNYDESTGVFNFDFKNTDWDTIVKYLSTYADLVGLTSDEWADMLIQIGQYLGINWGSYINELEHLKKIASGDGDNKTKTEQYGSSMQGFLGGDTSIDLTNRPMVSKAKMQKSGWDIGDESYSTLNSQIYTNDDNTAAITLTPVLPDGKALTKVGLSKYAKEILDGADLDTTFEFEGKTYAYRDLYLSKSTGENAQSNEESHKQALDEAMKGYDELRDTLHISTTIDEGGLSALAEIKELQDAISKNADGTVVINEEALRNSLNEAGYAEDYIDAIVDKMKQIDPNAFSGLLSDINKALDQETGTGVDGLLEIKELQDAIKKDANTGITILDTDAFTSVLSAAGYTEDQINDLIAKIQDYENVVSVSGNTDPLGLNNTKQNIDELKASLSTLGIEYNQTIGTLGDHKYDLEINVQDLVTTLQAKGWTDEQIKSYCQQLSDSVDIEGYNIKVNGIENIDEVIETANKVPDGKETEYTVTGTGESTLDSINRKWDSATRNKTTNYTINETTVKKTKNSGIGSWITGLIKADGTAHANGSWGAAKDETSLVGELGPELLVRDGRWTTIGENGAEFTDIKKGDIIFNHKQTESLLKNGYVTGRGKAYASGSLYNDGPFNNLGLDKAVEYTEKMCRRVASVFDKLKLDQLAKDAEEMCRQYEELVNGNVDLRNRPHLSPSYEHDLAMSGGYSSFIGSDGEIYASTSAETVTIGDEKNKYTIDITPVLENGEVLTSDSLDEYINNLVTDGSTQDLLDSDKYNLIIRAVPGEYDEKDWTEFEDELSKYKDGYLNTIIDMFNIGGEEAVGSYGFSSVGLSGVVKDLQNNGSYDGKEVVSAIDSTSDGMRNLDDLINQYVTDVLNAKSLADDIGTDLSKTKYGNIDTNNRQILDWDEKSVDKYGDAIESWGMKVDDLVGSYSTLLSSTGEFDGTDIAFTPILQTENGSQLLDSSTVDKYINGLIDKASENGGQWTSEDLFKLDTEGLEIDGTIIKNLLEDIGDNASKTSQLLHYVGDTGSIANLEGEIESTSSELVATGENVNAVQAKLDKLNATNISDKTFTVSTVYQTIGSGLEETARTHGASGRYTKYANGTVHPNRSAYNNRNFGANKTETALVGELGPEMLVRDGKWTTIGDNGAEFTQIKKGDIIFNHKQTEELLKNGYVTSRGKAYADGTAYVSGGSTFAKYKFSGNGGYTKYDVNDKAVDKFDNAASSISTAADSISSSADDISDAADEFEEVFDWIDIRLQEIDEELDLLNAQLDNTVGYSAQNSIIDQLLGVSNTKMSNLQAGLQEYANYASKLLAEIPAQYQEAAQNGAIAITEFAGEADEATVDAINNYRDWADKVADLTKQIEELRTEIASLAKQKFDNVSNEYDNVIKLIEDATDKLDAQVDLMEDRGYVAAKQYYESMMENTKQQSAELQKEKVALQDVLDQQVKLGNIKVGSDSWYEMVDALYEVDAAIVDCTANLEEYQNAINDIYWDNFDELINRLDYLNNETENLIDLMGNADIVTKPEGRTYEGGTTKYWTADDVQWTDEGIASLGLYAQQMEIAEYKSKQYGQAIDDLNKDYADGKYSESEYLEKLNELTSAQYDSIESYYDAQDSIKKLNETRIDSIKDGIEKEIDAYSELIDKKKEELDAEKDLYDWQKTVSEGQKNIADIQRKLTALSTDQSASAIAKRKKLEQELAEAKADLEEQYYDRSISDRSDALDKEQEDFENSKNKEIEKWEEYLDNIEQVVADSLGIVQANASGVYDTLSAKAQEYNLTLSDAIMTPWKDGAFAVSDYQDTFDTAMSSTWDQLDSIKMKWQEIIDKMAEAAAMEIKAQQAQNNRYGSATYTPPEPAQPSQPAPAPAQKTISVGGQINAGSARIYSDSEGHGGGRQYYRNDPIYTVLKERNGYILVRHHSESSGYTGWFKKSDVTALAKGTKGLDKSGIVNVDELGEELVLRAQNGRLTYMEKGTGVIPADLTSNLMEWGQLDPRDMIEQNRPSVSVPSEIKNTEINLSISYGDMLHIEEFNGEDPDEIAKIVAKQFEKHTKDLNNALRRYSR